MSHTCDRGHIKVPTHQIFSPRKRKSQERGLVPGTVILTRTSGGLIYNSLIPDILHIKSYGINILEIWSGPNCFV
jgi:hypothetical protein